MDFRDILRARPLIAVHLKKDFASFCRAAWPHLHRGTRLSWMPAHDLICENLMAVWAGTTKRLIVNCPPRFAKSSIVTILFPIWCWLQDPSKAFLCCSYEIDLSTNHNLDRRRLMDSKWFKDLFGDCFQLSTDRSQAGEFSNTAGGVMMAASVNSKAMGRGGDVIIVDDPLSADQAFSDIFRKETNDWFEFMLPQRLNDPARSAIILVMQRLHADDPTGHLLETQPGEWTLAKLPLIAEEDELWKFPVSGRTLVRNKGRCLDPKRFTPKVVKQRQANRLVWAGQFQQEPAPVEGNLIRTGDIQYFGGKDPYTKERDPALPETFDRKIISVDCSFKDRSTSDYVAILVIGIAGSRRYLVHVTNAHLDLDGTESEIRHCHQVYGPISATLIEDKANGSAVISHLTGNIPGVIAVNPEGGKMSRMMAASPEFQARNWYVERGGPWTNKVIEQLTMFPAARNDDIADALSQASIWLQANSYEYGWLDYVKAVASGRIAAEPSMMLGLATNEHPPNQVTVDSWRKWVKEGKAPPCSRPECGSTNTVFVGGRTGPVVHCNDCSADGGVLSTPEEKSDHVHRWRVIPCGWERCDDCAEQRPMGNGARPANNGMSRAQYAARNSTFGRSYGRFKGWR